MHRPVALGDRRVDLAHGGVERPVDRPDRQPLDPLQRRRRRQPDRTPGSAESTTKTRLESGSLPTISLARSLASSSRVLSLSLYSIDRLVSKTRPSAVGCDSSPSGTCDRAAAAPGPAPSRPGSPSAPAATASS